MTELWTPNMVGVETHARRVAPTERKPEGGSHFDDELDLASLRHADLMREGARLVAHLQQRPDHTVYVSSVEERDKMRQVFNVWFKEGALNYHPTIRIDYGVRDGEIRIA